MKEFAITIKIAIGNPSGARNTRTKNIFTIIGVMTTDARGTNLPERKAMPQSSSTTFTVGIRYIDAASPAANIFMAPVGSGGVMSFNRKVIDENKNKSPMRLRTIINPIFMKLSPSYLNIVLISFVSVHAYLLSLNPNQRESLWYAIV